MWNEAGDKENLSTLLNDHGHAILRIKFDYEHIGPINLRRESKIKTLLINEYRQSEHLEQVLDILKQDVHLCWVYLLLHSRDVLEIKEAGPGFFLSPFQISRYNLLGTQIVLKYSIEIIMNHLTFYNGVFNKRSIT